MKAIIETAHSLHTTVTAHAYTTELVTTLAELELMVLSVPLIDEVTESYWKKKIFIVPTFCPYDEIVLLDEES